MYCKITSEKGSTVFNPAILPTYCLRKDPRMSVPRISYENPLSKKVS
jgi:hypothetical protein